MFPGSRLRVEQGAREEAGDGRERGFDGDESAAAPSPKGAVTLTLEIRGLRPLPKLVQRLNEVSGVVSVNAGEDELTTERALVTALSIG